MKLQPLIDTYIGRFSAPKEITLVSPEGIFYLKLTDDPAKPIKIVGANINPPIYTPQIPATKILPSGEIIFTYDFNLPPTKSLSLDELEDIFNLYPQNIIFLKDNVSFKLI